MRDTRGPNARLSAIMLFVMLASMVLAACGGGQATTAPDGAAGGTTPGAVGTTPAAVGGEETVGTGATAAADPAAIATTIATVGTTAIAETTAGVELSPEADETAGAGATGTVGAGTDGAPPAAGAGGDCGISAALPAVDTPADANPNGKLVYNAEVEPQNGDPQISSFVNEIQYNSLVFRGLLNLNAENKPTFAGAESCTLSDGGKTWTFKIRQGMNYSDGRAVTAGDYEYAIKRSCDPIVAGNYSYVMYDIVGCQEFREVIGENDEGTPNPTPPEAELQKLRDAVGVKATDERTLQITLKNAVGYFPYIMSLWTTYPSRKDMVDKGGARWWTKPETFIGNGAFKLQSFSPTRIVFARNDNFFRGKPRLSQITYEIVENEQRFLGAYQSGAIDIVEPTGESLALINRNAQLKQQLKRAPEASSLYIELDLTFAPFKKLEVRQAFAAALDRELLIRQVNLGVGKPSGGFLYPGLPGYKESPSKQKFDPARAKQLLEQGGYPNGRGFPTIVYPYASDNALAKKAAVFIAQQYKQVLGVTITPRAVDSVELIRIRKSRKPNEHPDMFGGGWFQDYPHPQNFVSLVFSTDPGNTLGPLGFKDEQFQSLIEKADKILDIEEAAPVYAQADARLAEQAPVIFTRYGESLALTKPYVKGTVSYPGDPAGLSRQPESIYVTNEKR